MKKISKPNDRKEKEYLVITPAGPISKNKVHMIRSGEGIRIDKSGKAIVEPSREAWSKRRDLSEDLVITPGGFRSSSLVHQIGEGHVLRVTNGILQMINKQSEEIVANFGPISLNPGKEPLMPKNVSLLSKEVRDLASGWIVYAGWTNNTGTPISSFRTSWVVPPAPSTQSGQIIFLFNGIQNSTMIYQPVLQWGNNGKFGGNYWVVASWYTGGQGEHSFYTQPVQVNEGDVLVGVMTLVNQSGNSFSYNCEFQGIVNTSLPIQNVQELNWCVETLEAYMVQNCSDYPNTPYTAFQEIEVQTGMNHPVLRWEPMINFAGGCKQDVVIVSNDNPRGEVDLFYRDMPADDLFIRDNLQDHGSEPLIGGGISCSPDIIVFNQELLNPEAQLGTPAAQQNDTLGQKVEYGQDNFIYLRVQNRGTQPTSGTAKVFWTDPSVFPTPKSWTEITNPINPTVIPAINPKEMKIIGPIVWNKGDIPNKGHYCFIGLITSDNDPAPDPATIHTIDDYYNFIRLSNNATWKNFDVDDMFRNSLTSMDFAIQGWPRIKLSADLMIDLSQLPIDMKVTLRILKRLSSSASLVNANLVKESNIYQQFELVAGSQSFLRKISLKASDSCQATIQIAIPEHISDGNYLLAVSEIIDGKEMGRITRMLSIGQYPYMGNRRTREVHLATCEWAAKISRRNKEAYKDLKWTLKPGYDGCRFCLPEYSKD